MFNSGLKFLSVDKHQTFFRKPTRRDISAKSISLIHGRRKEIQSYIQGINLFVLTLPYYTREINSFRLFDRTESV